MVHVQAQGGSFRGVMKQSEVKCEELEKVIGRDDKVFYIRECEDSAAQFEVLGKVEACLFPEPIQYTYNGHYGSCQTFCSRILGQTLFEELNPEAFLTSATGLKAIASWWLGGDPNADGLVEEMNNRFDNLIPYDLPPQGERLMKTYPENSQLGTRS